METTTSIADMHRDAAVTDVTKEFEELRTFVAGLFAQVSDRLELHPDPAVEEFHSYGVEGGPKGSIRAYAGPEVDWAIHSWIGNPTTGFTNLHLTVWLGPQTWVPHLGLALGTLPDYWYYVDYVPRVDMLADTEYLDRYFQPHNDSYMATRNEPGFSPFVSQELYIRQAVSNTALCCVVERTPANAERMIELARQRVTDWIAFLDAGDPTAPEDRERLAARDLYVRRTVCERDPANVIGVRFFGEEMTDRLVKSLWGGNRTLPRPAP